MATANHLNTSIAEAIRVALEHHQAGRLPQAGAIYRQILRADPNHPDALHYLGAIALHEGKNEMAAELIGKAIRISPSRSMHYNLGNALQAQGRLDAAAESYRNALSLKPDYAEAHINLGNVFQTQGKLDEAIMHYHRGLSLRPDNAEAHYNLGNALKDQGKFDAALESYRRALQLGASNESKIGFAQCIRNISFTREIEGIRPLVIRAISEPWGRPGDLVTPALSLIKLDHDIRACIDRAAQAWPAMLSGQELYGHSGLAAVAGDQLLQCVLENAPACDSVLERFLTMARSAMLDAASGATAADVNEEKALAFYCALARQCFNTEYVFACADEELGRAQWLREQLAAAVASGSSFPPLWLVAVAAYFPLSSMPQIETLLEQPWTGAVAALLAQQVREPLQERQLRDGIPSLTAVEDDVSRLVRQQYEENPYPRWIKSPPCTHAATVDAFLHKHFPFASFKPTGNNDGVDILIAGCGTGQHSIQTAQQFRGARVLALDLSLSSISYAKRKTLELGLKNIEYAQADIMKLGSIGRTFDLIESVGVLHHMADPMAGWRQLVLLLRPGGLMRLGFYSELARQHIVAARNFIAERGYVANVVDIRRFRQDLAAMETTPEVKRVMSASDYFATSGCRDLLFHVQEHRYTLPQLKENLAELDLELIGFYLEQTVLKRYGERFPGDISKTNLDNWNIFENENPGTFAGMYQFSVQMRG